MVYHQKKHSWLLLASWLIQPFLCLFVSAGTIDKSFIPVTSDTEYEVYIFLSEKCPICQSVTTELKKLYSEYHQKGFDFKGIMPNVEISTEESIGDFKKKYVLPFTFIRDTTGSYTQWLSATITPQVFVVRRSDKAIVYSGKIDNSFERVGRRRTVVTDRYLRSALQNLSAGYPPNPTQTKAVGCYIIRRNQTTE